MLLVREGSNPIQRPSEARIRNVLSNTKMSFASLTKDNGAFLQVAGGPGLFVLERRDADGKHFRGWQQTPVVHFEDGTMMAFSAGELELRRDEWFLIDQVVTAFAAFAGSEPLPSTIQWRALDESYAYAR